MTSNATNTGPQPFRPINIEFTNEEFDSDEYLAVRAKDLHRILQITDDAHRWVERAIEGCGYELGVDYDIEILEEGGKGDFMLGIQMAKELAVACRSDRGNEARKFLADKARDLLFPLPPGCSE